MDTMNYIGRTKVGKVRTNPSTVLSIVRLPVELKGYAGKWAQIWKVDDDTIVIKFSDRKEVEMLPSVHFGVHVSYTIDVEKRLERLEGIVEGLLKGNITKTDNYYTDNLNKKGPDRDSNPAPGIHSPRG